MSSELLGLEACGYFAGLTCRNSLEGLRFRDCF